MSHTQSAPCPHCRGKNFVYRRVCWKCGRTLPTSFNLEGVKAYSFAQPAAESTSVSEIAVVPAIAETTTTGERHAGRAEFRELVRGLIEKAGVS